MALFDSMFNFFRLWMSQKHLWDIIMFTRVNKPKYNLVKKLVKVLKYNLRGHLFRSHSLTVVADPRHKLSDTTLPSIKHFRRHDFEHAPPFVLVQDPHTNSPHSGNKNIHSECVKIK